MSRLLRHLKGAKSLRGIGLATLVGCVGLACVALMVRGVSYLRSGPSARPISTGGARLVPPAAAASALQIGEQVLSRNIFDSTGGGQPWEEARAQPPDSEGEADDGGVVGPSRCSGDLRLLASVVHGRDPSRSIAALRKDGKTHIMRIGAPVGELELVALYPTEAFFRIDGNPCSLPVYLTGNAAPPPPPPVVQEPPAAAPAVASTEPTSTRPRRAAAFSEDELKRNIRVLGPARYAVTRELFTRARMNPTGISRGTRFKPKMEEGRSAGMQVFRIRDDSLLAHLGVKQGDVLRGINGFSLGSADGVLEAMGHLGKKNEVTLSIERGGTLTTIQYVLE